MKTSILTIADNRTITAANFVTRTPPMNWAVDNNFSPTEHFLYYHLEGSRVLGYDDKQFTITPDTFVFFYKGGNYYSPLPTQAYKAMNISFTSVNNDSFIPNNRNNPETLLRIPFLLNLNKQVSLRYLFEEVVYSCLSRSPLKKLKASVMLSQLLIEVAETHGRKQDEIPVFIDTVISVLERHPETSMTLDELAEKANMSRATLTRTFRKATGKSVQQFHLDIKIKHALSIMKNNPEVRIKEIAFMLNFYDEYHFSKTFKRIIGISPFHYKQKLT